MQIVHRAIVIDPDGVIGGDHWRDQKVQIGECLRGVHTVDVEADVVVVGVAQISLPEGVELNGDKVVVGVPVDGSIGESEKGTVAPRRRRAGVGGEEESQPLAWGHVFNTEDVYFEGGVEGQDLLSGGVGGGRGVDLPELKRPVVEDSPGFIDEVAGSDVGGIGGELEDALAEFGVVECQEIDPVGGIDEVREAVAGEVVVNSGDDLRLGAAKVEEEEEENGGGSGGGEAEERWERAADHVLGKEGTAKRRTDSGGGFVGGFVSLFKY